SAESTPGQGSAFTLRLPGHVTPVEAPAEPPAPLVGPLAGGAGTVLVIDDDPSVRDWMKRFLTREGFRPVTASGGEEGLRLAAQFHPDVIVLDVMMPGMDGWAV